MNFTNGIVIAITFLAGYMTYPFVYKMVERRLKQNGQRTIK